jgi:hypothetical protein
MTAVALLLLKTHNTTYTNTLEAIQVGQRKNPFERAKQIVLDGGTTHKCKQIQQEINIILDIRNYFSKYPTHKSDESLMHSK